MSIAASGTSEAGSGLALRYLDLIALLLALPLFVVADLPLGGYALGAGVWLGQRLLQVFFDRKIRGSEDPKAIVGYTAGGAIARGWLSALAILTIGLLTEDKVGLSAVVLILGLFSLYFVGRVIERAGAAGGGP